MSFDFTSVAAWVNLEVSGWTRFNAHRVLHLASTTSSSILDSAASTHSLPVCSTSSSASSGGLGCSIRVCSGHVTPVHALSSTAAGSPVLLASLVVAPGIVPWLRDGSPCCCCCRCHLSAVRPSNHPNWCVLSVPWCVLLTLSTLLLLASSRGSSDSVSACRTHQVWPS